MASDPSLTPSDNNNKDDLTAQKEAAGRHLSECLFAQYGMTFGAISTATAYAVYKKPPNGIALMVGAGVAGTVADLGYGWTRACRAQVEQWTTLRAQVQQQQEAMATEDE